MNARSRIAAVAAVIIALAGLVACNSRKLDVPTDPTHRVTAVVQVTSSGKAIALPGKTLAVDMELSGQRIDANGSVVVNPYRHEATWPGDATATVTVHAAYIGKVGDTLGCWFQDAAGVVVAGTEASTPVRSGQSAQITCTFRGA
jgi:hypothetical protein